MDEEAEVVEVEVEVEVEKKREVREGRRKKEEIKDQR